MGECARAPDHLILISFKSRRGAKYHPHRGGKEERTASTAACIRTSYPKAETVGQNANVTFRFQRAHEARVIGTGKKKHFFAFFSAKKTLKSVF